MPNKNKKKKHDSTPGPASKYTPANVKKILKAISNGMTQKDSGLMIGICEDTVCLWKKEHSDFSDKISAAELGFKQSLIKGVKKAKSWASKAWLLERKFKDEYAERKEVKADVKTSTHPDISKLTEEELKKLAHGTNG